MSPDELIGVLSRWLAGHLGNDELRKALAEADRATLSESQAEAIDELAAELAEATPRARGSLGRVVRETLEALALG